MNYPTIEKVRRIDELGRIVIPKEIRVALDIKEGNSLKISVRESGEIVITKVKESDYLIRKTQFGEELINIKTNTVVLSRAKITPQDIANIVGLELEIE